MAEEKSFKLKFVTITLIVEIAILLFISLGFYRYLNTFKHLITEEYQKIYLQEEEARVRNVVMLFVKRLKKDYSSMIPSTISQLKIYANEIDRIFVPLKHTATPKQLFNLIINFVGYSNEHCAVLNKNFKVIKSSIKGIKDGDNLKSVEKFLKVKPVFSGVLSIHATPYISYIKFDPNFNVYIMAAKPLEKIENKLKEKYKTEMNNFRYRVNGTGYVFVIKVIFDKDNKPIFYKGIVLPNKPDFVGKYVDINKRKDAKGNLFAKKMVEIALSKGRGYVNYYYKILGTNQISFKTSFIYYFKPWHWIIGSGFHPGIFESKLQKREKKLSKILLISVLKLSAELFIFEILIFIIAYFFIDKLMIRLKEYRTKLVKKEKFQAHLIDSIPNPLIVVDENGNIITKNEAFSKFFCKEDTNSLTEYLKKIYETDQQNIYEEKEINVCSQPKYLGIHCSMFKDEYEEGLIAIIFDLTHKKHTQDKLLQLSIKDGLTNLFNRRHFNKIFYDEVDKSLENEKPFSLIIFDIDHFKKINDTYGHDIGDIVLKELSQLISDSVRASDMVFRIGGEEFAVLLLGTDAKTAYTIAEKLRKIVENHDFEKVGKVTISLGVAGIKENDSPDELFKKADKALYEAKNSGRNRTVLSD
ncbi:diguanylate cyclase [Hippea jasoniae]|uniref:diguanylate cyclase n=1 Tax=Hippea jasoniae TaxID=944479 RepID=UPI00068BC62B|nr:diguanylate cyclase [Hippea jasoniae]